eukprot:GILJ01000626.1.p1 GENE.GILJ01000626.1~~GILJ01000626.1.p1  ORF type:complete len:250 (-),score=47.94 GILJ01000626.1:209-958(-)
MGAKASKISMADLSIAPADAILDVGPALVFKRTAKGTVNSAFFQNEQYLLQPKAKAGSDVYYARNKMARPGNLYFITNKGKLDKWLNKDGQTGQATNESATEQSAVQEFHAPPDETQGSTEQHEEDDDHHLLVRAKTRMAMVDLLDDDSEDEDEEEIQSHHSHHSHHSEQGPNEQHDGQHDGQHDEVEGEEERTDVERPEATEVIHGMAESRAGSVETEQPQHSPHEEAVPVQHTSDSAQDGEGVQEAT